MVKVNEILKKGETFESLASKAIQTHMLALNFTSQLQMFISNTCAAEFGKTFVYEKAYLGIIDGEEIEHVMVEPFISGEFKKYLNNNGSPIREDPKDLELVQKAVCLAHYTYEKSGEKLLLLDIQGSNYVLYDPEIATKDNAIDESCGLRFCMGNLSVQAFSTFMSLHICNKYCKMVGLKPLPQKTAPPHEENTSHESENTKS